MMYQELISTQLFFLPRFTAILIPSLGSVLRLLLGLNASARLGWRGLIRLLPH
jgi:hypothetical protein